MLFLQEMSTFAEEMKWDEVSLKDIALKACLLPKKNQKRARIVTVTQGREPVLLAYNGVVTEIPVIALPKEDIVDTNGAGDAFAGGFLAQLVLGKSFEVCVKCGIYAASEIIKRSGCTFSGKPNFSS